jgi:hypothetical protein
MYVATVRRVELASLFKRRRLAPGTRIEVTVTAPATVARIASFRVTRRGVEQSLTRCVRPGQSPTSC